MAKAGVAPITIRLLQAVLVEAAPDSETGNVTSEHDAHVQTEGGGTKSGEHVDREGKSITHDWDVPRMYTNLDCCR